MTDDSGTDSRDPNSEDGFARRIEAGLVARASAVDVVSRESEILHMDTRADSARRARVPALMAAIVAAIGLMSWVLLRPASDSRVDTVPLSVDQLTPMAAEGLGGDLAVWMDPEAATAEHVAVRALLDLPLVGSFRFLDQEMVYAEFVELFSDTPELSAVVTADVLPELYRLVLISDFDADDLAEFEIRIEGLPGVRAVVRGPSFYESAQADADLGEPVDLNVLAVRPNNLSFALLDLAAGSVTVTGPDDHVMGAGAASGASISPRGDALVWRDGVYVFAGADMRSEPKLLLPARWRLIPTFAPELRVVPTTDGAAVWIVQHASYWNENAIPAVVDLVSVDTGEVRLTIEVPMVLDLVGSAGDGLLVNAWDPVEVSGSWNVDYGHPRALIIEPDGSMTALGNWEAVGVWDKFVAGIEGDELVVVDVITGERVAVERPTSTRWVASGGPLIPSTAQPLPQVSAKGELLMYLVSDESPSSSDVFSEQNTLVAVSLPNAEVRLVDEVVGVPLPTWTRDGERVVLVGSELTVLGDVPGADPLSTIDVPDGHFAFGAG